MKFKIKINENTKHQDICTSVRWTVNNEAYSLSDDNTVLKWDPNSLEVILIENYYSAPNYLIWSPLPLIWISYQVLVGSMICWR